jgi:hypothetical protein
VNSSHPSYLTPEEKQTERFEVILKPLLVHLRYANQTSLVKQNFADFLNIDFKASDRLVGSLIKAKSDPSKPASAQFINDQFIQSEKDDVIEEDFTEVDFKDHFNLIRLLQKVATLINKLNIPSDELDWLVNESDQVEWLDLNLLPVEKEVKPIEEERFLKWFRMARFSLLNKKLPTGKPSLFLLLRMAHTGKDTDDTAITQDVFIKKLCERTRWDSTDVKDLFHHLNITFNKDFQKEKALTQILRFNQCFRILKQLGVSAKITWQWAQPKPTRKVVNEIKLAAKAKYDEDQWLSIAEPIRDKLRKKQSTVLIDATLSQVNSTHPDIKDVNDLYGFFLMDIEMNPCMITSRVKQAISSVQLFMHRCLMNLEDEVELGTAATKQWNKWRKNYRVWEANRKVFLYPENWIEPELRPEKSPFFVDLENELLQNDVTKDTAETAVLNYLEKLDEVARLEVASVYNDEETNTLHVISRTKGIPHKYYYRRWVKGRRWTPWEFVPVDIEGENIAVTLYNRRLYIFWLMITEKASEDIETKEIDMTKQKPAIDTDPPMKYHKINLAWSQYRYGKWTAKKISNKFITSKPSRNFEEDYPENGWSLCPLIRNQDGNLLIAIMDYLGLESVNLERPKNFLFFNDGQVELDHYSEKLVCPHPSWIKVTLPGSVSRSEYYYPINGMKLWVVIGENSYPTLLNDCNKRDIPNANSRIIVSAQDLHQELEIIESTNPKRMTVGLMWFYVQSPFFFEDRERSYFVTRHDIYHRNEIMNSPFIPNINLNVILAEDIVPWENIRTGDVYFDKPSLQPNLKIQQQSLQIILGFKSVFTGQSSLETNKLDASNVYDADRNIVTKNPFKLTSYSRLLSGIMKLNQPMPSPNSFNPLMIDPISSEHASIITKFSKTPGCYTTPIATYVGTKFRFHTFYHPYVNFMIRHLNRYGIDGLLSPIEYGEAHDLRRQLMQESKDLAFEKIYELGDDIDVKNLPEENFDFTSGGAYSIYNWELFFHMPFLIATRLSANQQFEEAQKWYHFIFDPTDVSDVPPEKEDYRFWKIKPFYENTDQNNIERLMRLLDSEDPANQKTRDALRTQIDEWEDDPFQPHLIAQNNRYTAYQKAVVMKYIDNLIVWGDQLFHRDTIESINQATQLYILASQILGKQPDEVPRPKGEKVIDGKILKTFTDLEPYLDEFKNALVQLETELPDSSKIVEPPYEKPTTADIIGSTLFFCIPHNDKLLSYWDIVADRLFKIRNCMNIKGVVRQLRLFEPPIDPSLLVRAATAGIDLSSILNDMNAPLPIYRFNVILQKAIELCNDVKQLGSTLLSAIEKRDAEDLALLRSSHEEALLKAVILIRESQLDESKETLEGLEKNLESTKERYNFYTNRKPRILNEKLQLDKLDAANTKNEIAQGLMLAKTAIALIPQIDLGSSGFAASPVVKAKFGGIQLSNELDAASQVLSFLALLDRNSSNRASIVAGYDRRQEEWDFQAAQAEIEIEAFEKQIEASKIRIEIAKQELKNQELQIEHTQEVDEFMHTKYTNKELYSWMVTQISTIYFQSYQLAYDVTKRAERAYQHELADYNATFIEFGYWDSLKKGLLAGERLYLDLKRMEMAYFESNRREYELTKHISLAQLDPVALVQLRETGTCEIEIPEVLFDLDYPSHFVRRIKSVSLSIPCVTGPYTGVNCTLTLLSNRIRVSTTDPAITYGGFDDNRFISNVGGIQSIATSSALEDSGLFELNFRDERYLPFEGAGVIGRLRLELSNEYRQFDYDTISDVILHMRYTSREAGATLKTEVLKQIDTAVDNIAIATSQTGLFHFISMKREFGNAFHQFLNPVGKAEHNTTITMSKTRLPFIFQNKIPDIKDVFVLLKLRVVSLYNSTESPLALTITRNNKSENEKLKLEEDFVNLPIATYEDLNGELTEDENWELRVSTTDVNNLPDTLKYTIDVEGETITRLKGDEIEDVFLLINYKIG